LPVHAWPNETVTPSLVIRFKEGKLESYFSLGVMPHTESGESRSYTLRFDSSPAKDYEGSLSTDGKGLFIEETRFLLREIASADKLTLRFTPFNSSPVTTTFNLKGFTNASKELLSAAMLDLKDRNIQFEDAYVLTQYLT
jgi:type VI secretion system protein VasI